MDVNRNKPDKWKADVAKSVDYYNNWFLEFAPQAYRNTRIETTKQVESALKSTDNLKNVTADLLYENPEILPMLRASTCPPIARDRLIGLAGVSANLVKSMEKERRLPPRMDKMSLESDLTKIGELIERLADKDIFVWLSNGNEPSPQELYRASTIVADRLCGAIADPIIRNEQEKRQLKVIKNWLEKRGYKMLESNETNDFKKIPKGTFSFRFNVPVFREDKKKVNIPVDVIIMRKDASDGDYPLLLEAKSAGDFTNTNKRRKEEAQKMTQLRKTYGSKIEFNLFLCGYFDSGYLGYEAAEGIDWVWEHRIDDLEGFNL